MIRKLLLMLLVPFWANAGESSINPSLIEFVAGRSQDGSVLIGLRFIDQQCTGFAHEEDDWFMAVDGASLVVRYGDATAARGDSGNCGFGPLTFGQWPSLNVALSADDYLIAVPDSVQHVRLEFARTSCLPESNDVCVPDVTRFVLAEARLSPLPRTAARLEAGIWRPDPGAGSLGQPGGSLQLREDGSALSLVWIGADTAGDADWVFAGGHLPDAAAALPTFSSRAGLCAHCRPPDLHLVDLDRPVTVWIRSATEIWLGGLAVRGRSRPMQPWRPWSIRPEQNLTWPVTDPVSGVAIAQGRAQFADLEGTWQDIHRLVAHEDGQLRFERLATDSQRVVYGLAWTGGNGQAVCGPAGECTVDHENGTTLRFPLAAIGADRIYAPSAPCSSQATCDAQLGGLFLMRLE